MLDDVQPLAQDVPSPLKLGLVFGVLVALVDDADGAHAVEGGEVVEATVPAAVGKSPAEVELALRRAGFNDITVVDANGNPTNSLVSLTGRVASIDPPAGTSTMTDQPITITLE